MYIFHTFDTTAVHKVLYIMLAKKKNNFMSIIYKFLDEFHYLRVNFLRMNEPKITVNANVMEKLYRTKLTMEFLHGSS